MYLNFLLHKQVYYTRDSPLTITSVLTTTLPPITYVSTIIGTKTILGTYNSITPTKTDVSSRLMSTPSVSPASSTYILSSSSVLPVATTRPRLHRPKEPNVLKAKVTPFLSGRKPAKPNPNQTSPMMTMRNRTNSMIDHQMCNPTCNVTNKEMCKEVETSRYACECRPGYVRRPSDNLCQGESLLSAYCSLSQLNITFWFNCDYLCRNQKLSCHGESFEDGRVRSGSHYGGR